MSINQCIINGLGTKLVGMMGFLSNEAFSICRSCEKAQYFYPPDESINAILRGDITATARAQLLDMMNMHLREFKQEASWMSVITFATPALEVLSRDQLSAFGLELFSLNELIAKYCVKSGIRRPALLGTEWDTAPDGPLAKILTEYGLEVQHLDSEDRRLYHLMTSCVFSRMENYISYGSLPKEARDFCADVANRLLFKTAGTLDAFIICNAEMNSFISYLRYKSLKGGSASIPIINVSALHLAELNTRTFKKPPS